MFKHLEEIAAQLVELVERAVIALERIAEQRCSVEHESDERRQP